MRYREVLARSTSPDHFRIRAAVFPVENRYSTWHEREIETLMKKSKNRFTLLDESAQPRLDTHQNGRAIVGRARLALASGEVAPWKLHEPHEQRQKALYAMAVRSGPALTSRF
jgi:hypothetical protein